jgi:hypothetical protein
MDMGLDETRDHKLSVKRDIAGCVLGCLVRPRSDGGNPAIAHGYIDRFVLAAGDASIAQNRIE